MCNILHNILCCILTSRDWTWNATKEELRMIKLIQNGKFVRKGQVINRYFWIVLRFDKLSVSSTVTNMSLLCALKWVFSNTHFEALLSTMTKIYEWSQFPITWRKLNFSKENWRILFSENFHKLDPGHTSKSWFIFSILQEHIWTYIIVLFQA